MPASHCYPYPHPAVTTDVAAFRIRDQRLELLLIRRAADPFQGHWALPGGFLEIDEDLDACARRELAEETGLAGHPAELYLEQLYTFGAVDRDPRERVVSVAYLAVIAGGGAVEAGSDAAAVRWFPVNELPPLAFDHARIIRMARERLAVRLGYSSIAFRFLGDTFTLGEVQRVYETLREAPVDKRNFRKFILAQGCIEESGEERRGGGHRPARVYRLCHPGRVEPFLSPRPRIDRAGHPHP